MNVREDLIRLHHQNKCNHDSTKIKRNTKKKWSRRDGPAEAGRYVGNA